MDPIDSLSPLLAAAVGGGGGTGGTISGLLFYISIAIGFSFLCSILEAAMLSTPPSYVESQAEQGTRVGRLFQKHKQNVDEPITAILTLNTFAHTIGAAGAGAQAVGVFGEQWFGVITFILTFLILAFSEIIPKTLGAVYWKQLFSFTAYSVQILVFLFKPVIWLFKFMTHLITSDDRSPTVTRSELEMMAKISATEGAIEEKESRILKNLLQLNGVHVGDIMTPRTVMLAFQKDMTVSEVMQGKRVLPYSRIPVYGDNMDDIDGFVLRHDVLKRAANDQDSVNLAEFRREIHFVPETLTVTKVLDEFIQRQEHIFMVFDEYGGTAGLITMEDAVESLLGVEITDESDIVADMRQLAQQRSLRQMSLLEDTIRPTSNGHSPNGNESERDKTPITISPDSQEVS